MKCPHCGKELKLANRVYRNAETYSNTCLAATECCGYGVTVRPIVSFEVEKYQGTKTDDDWGADFKS